MAFESISNEEIIRESNLVTRQAKVLGSEYGLTDAQVSKLEGAMLDEQELIAREFKVENDALPKKGKPGDAGKRIAQQHFIKPPKANYFKNENNGFFN